MEDAQRIESYAEQLTELVIGDDDASQANIENIISQIDMLDRKAVLDCAIEALNAVDAILAEHPPKAYLLAPLGMIEGIGPKGVAEILLSRKTGKPLRPALQKKLDNPKTPIDSLYPISDRIKKLHPDLTEVGIQSRVMSIKEIQCGIIGPVVIAAVATRIATRDENDLAKIAKRGRKLSGLTMCLNMHLRDDTDEIFCKIDRFDFDRLALPIIEHGKPGKALYALKGTVPPDFRMIRVQRIIHLGDMERRLD
jgi:hypothetical protein